MDHMRRLGCRGAGRGKLRVVSCGQGDGTTGEGWDDEFEYRPLLRQTRPDQVRQHDTIACQRCRVDANANAMAGAGTCFRYLGTSCQSFIQVL